MIKDSSNSKDEDHELMERIARGDSVAFRILVDKHALRSLRFMERMTGNKEKAEDIVQEAFETVWKKAPDWTPKAKFTTWFYRVLVNMAHHSFRDRFRVYEVIDDNHEDETFSTEDYIIQNELGDAVKEALQEIPERQRIAITLFYYDELSQKQACEVMGISEGALESLLSRGRSALKKKFDKVSLE